MILSCPDLTLGGKLHVSRETMAALSDFVSHLQRWNSAINLVSDATSEAIWVRHILDSAQLAAIAPTASIWMDIGSGGGFPGLVMAFLLKGRPGSMVHLIESNRKKAGFLASTVGLFGLPAQVHAMRIEAFRPEGRKIEAVSSRALAPLGDLLALAYPTLAFGARGYFHKGRDYRQEVVDSRLRWSYSMEDHVSAVDVDSVVLEISQLRPYDRGESGNGERER